MSQIIRENVSILNVTKVELTKNRGNINWLIGNMQVLREEVGTMTEESVELDGFVQQHFQLIVVINKRLQTKQFLKLKVSDKTEMWDLIVKDFHAVLL